MHIRVINHYAVGHGMPGGTRHVDLGLEWAGRGLTVDVIASRVNHFSPGTRLPRCLRIAPGLVMRGVDGPSYRGNGPGRILNMTLFAVGAIALDITSPGVPDVYVGSSPHPPAALAASLLARLRGRPFVYEIRDLWPRTLEDLGGLRPGSLPARVLYSVESHLVGRADCVVIVAAGMKTYLSERGLSPRRILIAPNSGRDPVGDVAVPSEHASLLEELRAGGDVLFCYAGTLGPANGVADVVRAFAGQGAAGASLIVVGGGAEDGNLRRLAKELGARVHFLGQVPRNEVRALLAKCDVAVFHLHDGGVFRYGLSPNKLVDYLRAGRPILYAGPAVDNPTSGADCTVAAQPGDAADIQRAVAELVRMPAARRARLGENARHRGEQDYSVSRVAARYLTMLEETAVTHATARGLRRRWRPRVRRV